MSPRTPSLLAAALVASLPVAAHAGNDLYDTRFVRGETSASLAVVVTTTTDEPDLPTRIGGTCGDGGKPSPLAFAPYASTRVGKAEIGWRPGAEAAATLTLADAAGKTLGTYEGSVDADGRVRLTDRERALLPSIAGVVHASGSKGSSVVLTLDDGTFPAVSGALVLGGVKAEVAFGEEQVSWIAEVPASTSPLGDLRVWTESGSSPGRSGRTAWRRDDRLEAQLVAPWDDGGAGVPALPFGDAGLTSLALLPPANDGCGWGATCKEPGAHALVGFSAGWYAGDTLPASLDVGVVGGGTLSLPLNSAQRVGAVKLSFERDPTGREVEVLVDGQALRLDVGGRGRCMLGKCFSVAGSDGAWALVGTAFATDAARLPDTFEVAFRHAGGEKDPIVAPKEPSAKIELSDEIALVFARAVTPAPGAWGAPVVFEPALVGPREEGVLLAGAAMAARLTTGDGGLALSTRSRTGPVASKGDILIGGEPIGIERTAGGGKPEPVGPPVVWEANGAGTRDAIPSARGRPGLR